MGQRNSAERKARRQDERELFDELAPSDLDWVLCRRTGRSYWELRQLAAKSTGNIKAFLASLGYSTGTASHLARLDNGWWMTLNQWMRIYIPQWEEGFKRAVSTDLTTLPDPDAALAAMAKALNVDESILRHFSDNKENIEAFLEAQRSTLGTLAELKLWELLMQGDAATVRWALPRLKTAQFGDQAAAGIKAGDKGIQVIKVIDVE